MKSQAAFRRDQAMAKRSGARLAAGLAGALCIGGTAIAAKPAPPPAIPIVTGTVDFGAQQGTEGYTASFAFLESFPAAAAVIYLDLTIAPAVSGPEGGDQTLDFGVTGYGVDGGVMKEFPCALGGSQFIDRQMTAVSVAAGAIYPHLILDADIASGAAAPYNALSCDYAPAVAGQVVVHLTGFFVVQEAAIPTARWVRLVPMTPPFAEAIDALARSDDAP